MSTDHVTTIDTDRPGVPMSRLIKVEIRKTFDTRAGRWFSASILILCAIVMLVQVFAFREGNQDFVDFSSSMAGVLGYFLPVLLIMMVTSEFGQRTGLVTFTLEPRRSRNVIAKLSAGVIISLGVMALGFLIGIVGSALAGSVRGVDVSWDYPVSALQSFLLANLFGVLIAFALAMLIQNTAGAIVAYFVYSLVFPIVLGIVGYNVGWFEDSLPWWEFNNAQTPLFTGDFQPTGQQWLQIAITGTIWMILPLFAGIQRLLRAEVK